MEAETLHVYVLDNSDASCRSEDYNNSSRLLWQHEVVRTLSRAFLAPTRPSDDAPTSNDSLALVSSGGKPLTRIPPTKDSASLLSLDLTCHSGEECQFLPALRVALLAAKRASTARVLAFLASEASLPAEQCSQLSRAFADARVGLDVVLLTPPGELPSAALAALQLLTAATAYPAAPAPAAAQAAQAAAGPRAPGRPGAPRRPAGAAAAPGGTAGDPSSASAAASAPPPAATASGSGNVGGCNTVLLGQRLIHFPPPDPALALWQQLEPLLEVLQPDVSRQEGDGVEEARDTDEADQPGYGGSSASGRPPLPRPPRARSAMGAGAPAALRSGVGAPTSARSGLPPPGPLPSRSGGLQRSGRAGLPSGPCRYESLDSLQHLSLDGFLRSWLPSYANVGKVLLQPQPGAGGGSSSSSSGGSSSGGNGAGSSGASGGSGSASAGGGGSSVAGFGSAKLCYISVYRLQLPRWHKILEVHAGCCREVEAPEGEVPGLGQGRGSVAAANAPVATTPAAAQPPAGAATDWAPPPRPVVARAPNPVQVSFSTRCSSAAAAGGDGGGSPRPKSWVCPDARRGTLTMVASVENPGTVKLLWSERRGGGGGADGGGVDGGGAREYGSIFEASEPGDVDVQVSSAELDLTLSPTKTEFRIVPHVSGGVVLEVRAPRNVVHRPPTSLAAAGGAGGCASAPLQPSTSSAGAADGRPGSRDGKLFWFWLQQEFRPDQRYPPGDAAAASSPSSFSSPPSGATSPSTSISGAAGGSGSGEGDGQADSGRSSASGGGAGLGSGAAVTAAASARSGGAGYPSWRGRAGGEVGEMGGLALARRLQDLMELPPEFDPHKQSNRVRCNTTPLQLGPLPLQLVEEIMRASGRELNADGTITTLSAGGGGGSSSGAAGGSGRSSVSAAATAMAGVMRSILVPRAPARSQGSVASQTSAAARSHAATGAAAAGGERGNDALHAGGSSSADEGLIHRHAHHHHHHHHQQPRAAAAGRQAAGGSAFGPALSVAPVPAPAAVLYAKQASATAASPATAACALVAGADTNAGSSASKATASAAAATSAASAVAAAAMSSHPLDDLGTDWEDSDEEAEEQDKKPRSTGTVGTSMAPVSRSEPVAQDPSPRAPALPVTQALAADHQSSPRASGEESTACGFAAVASLPAAAAAAATSSASLVAAAAVDAAADGSSSCAEDASLMFELD